MHLLCTSGLMRGTYAGLHSVKEAGWASQFSVREYISWLLSVCQPDMPLWLSFGQIMLTWENSSIRLQLVFWDYCTISKQRRPDAPLTCELILIHGLHRLLPALSTPIIPRARTLYFLWVRDSSSVSHKWEPNIGAEVQLDESDLCVN